MPVSVGPSLADLRSLSAELTALYRDAGLMAARVIISRQVIRDGELNLTVLPVQLTAPPSATQPRFVTTSSPAWSVQGHPGRSAGAA